MHCRWPNSYILSVISVIERGVLQMKNTLVAVTLLSCSFVYGANLSAQARGTQRAQAADTGRMDLNTALITLDRVSQATQTDIASLHVENWKSGWKSGFLKSGTKQAEAQ